VVVLGQIANIEKWRPIVFKSIFYQFKKLGPNYEGPIGSMDLALFEEC
jgi:hypothetical protein